MRHQPIEFFADVGFPRQKHRLLVEPRGIQSMRLPKCVDLPGNPHRNRFRGTAGGILGLLQQHADAGDPIDQHAMERRAFCAPRLEESRHGLVEALKHRCVERGAFLVAFFRLGDFDDSAHREQPI